MHTGKFLILKDLSVKEKTYGLIFIRNDLSNTNAANFVSLYYCMKDRNTGRLRMWTPLLFSLILIIGMTLGFNLRDTLRNKRDIFTIIERNDRLEQLIDLVNAKYVDTVDKNRLYQDAITGILKNLDPHTVYIPADNLEAINENMDGGFFGIGVGFSIVRDTIQVTSVVENGPAERAGVQIGDQLIKVEDSIVAGIRITGDHIMHMLKGKQYSRVLVTLRDPLAQKQKKVFITRDIIPVYSVDASIMLDSLTGIIKINRFSATTYDEFMKALEKLQKQGMKQLIVDLRDNPGGYLDAATMITDELLDNDKLIVYTKGVHSARTEYRATENGNFERGRLAVLIDENSASASEILAGAIQDWDRGIILGRRSFGKGLVQQQYDMDDGAAIRLTVARYYTPSGRSIQRSFAKGKEAYRQDFEQRFTTGELTGQDTTKFADTTRYFTSRRRLVYGGGGIKPDIYVPYDTTYLYNGLLSMIFSEEVRGIIWDYYMQNRSTLRFGSIAQYDAQFNAETELVKRYMAALKPRDRKIAQSILGKPANSKYFNMQLKAQLGRFLFRDNGYYAITMQQDNVIQRTLRLLHSDTYLTVIGR